MALHYEIDPPAGRVQIVGQDVVTMTGMIAIVEAVASDARFRPHYTVLFDLRHARYTAELRDGDALAAVLKLKKNDFQNRFAVVVSPSLHILAKLYCLLADMAGFDHIQCFTDFAEAETWCQSP
ncbi:MAG: hypothetical protein K8T26_08415 [Lentisphaerae bacterium]|nr:hypothetical protein [Lentisphaerota bacterium]